MSEKFKHSDGGLKSFIGYKEGEIVRPLCITLAQMTGYIKLREFNGAIKTNDLGDEVPKENEHYICIACITIGSVMIMEKKKHLQVYLEECKYRTKKAKMTKFIKAELESKSQLEHDIELELKSELESDTE